MEFCNGCGLTGAIGLVPQRCQHTVCAECRMITYRITSKATCCGACAFDAAASTMGAPYLVLVLPRPRDAEARAIVSRHCTLAGMEPHHRIAPARASEISQAFTPLVSEGADMVMQLERDLAAADFRLLRYMHPTRPGVACAVVLDGSQRVYGVSWGGVREKVSNVMCLPLAQRRIMAALGQEFVSGTGNAAIERVSWLRTVADGVCNRDWCAAFGDVSSAPELQYVAYDATEFTATTLLCWAVEGEPATLVAPGAKNTHQSREAHSSGVSLTPPSYL